jgi:1-phosphofructokinase family hexose kinase
MIVTITLNTGLDHVLFCDGFEWGRTIRAQSSVLGMGCKGVDVAWILAELGKPALALGWAAGPNGTRMDAMLVERGVTTDFVWVEGETRLNTVVVDTRRKAQSTITVGGLTMQPEHYRALKDKVAAALADAPCLVLGGSVPASADPAIYVELIEMARGQGVPTILDASGVGLREGIKAGPTVVKPNRDEVQEWAGRPLPTLADVVQAAQEMLAGGIERVVVTLGREGALAVSAAAAYLIPPIDVPVVNAAGAGDGFVAGLATMYAEGLSWVEGLRLGAAIATAVLLTQGTADCHREDVYKYLPQVRCEELAR